MCSSRHPLHSFCFGGIFRGLGISGYVITETSSKWMQSRISELWGGCRLFQNTLVLSNSEDGESWMRQGWPPDLLVAFSLWGDWSVSSRHLPRLQMNQWHGRAEWHSHLESRLIRFWGIGPEKIKQNKTEKNTPYVMLLGFWAMACFWWNWFLLGMASRRKMPVVSFKAFLWMEFRWLKLVSVF